MAKRKSSGVNKSEAIREFLKENPKSSTREIIDSLAGKGTKVNPSLVYFIKGKMKRTRRKQIGKRMAQAGISNPVDLILKVRQLAHEAGGMTKLKQLIDALAE